MLCLCLELEVLLGYRCGKLKRDERTVFQFCSRELQKFSWSNVTYSRYTK